MAWEWIRTKRNLLVVDADSDTFESTKEDIRARVANCAIVHACTCADALDLLENRKFELIVCEYSMPDMTGAEFCRTLRARDRITPVIIYTALHRPVDRDMAMSSGANAYLCRPDELSLLTATLNQLLPERTAEQRYRGSRTRSSAII